MNNKFILITNYEICPIKARLESVQEYISDQFELEQEANPHLFSCLEKCQELIMHIDLYHESIGYDPVSDKKSNIEE